MTGKVCKARKYIINHNASVSDRITDRISNLKDDITQAGKNGIGDLKNMKNKADKTFDTKKKELKDRRCPKTENTSV